MPKGSVSTASIAPSHEDVEPVTRDGTREVVSEAIVIDAYPPYEPPQPQPSDKGTDARQVRKEKLVGMACPMCFKAGTRVLFTRTVQVRILRTRKCESCHRRFLTAEAVIVSNYLPTKREPPPPSPPAE
jgi:hypothetical protein